MDDLHKQAFEERIDEIAQQYLDGLSSRATKLIDAGVSSKDHVTVRNVFKGIAIGLSNTKAANYAGIDPNTLQKWIQRTPHLKQCIEQAKAIREAGLISKVHRAADEGNWKAAAWILENQVDSRDDWSPKQIEQNTGMQIVFNFNRENVIQIANEATKQVDFEEISKDDDTE